MDEINADAIYESTPGDERELALAIRVCLMGTNSFPPLTFSPKGCDEEEFCREWKAWHDSLFADVLGPHLVRCHLAARANQITEVLEADLALDSALAEVQRDRSAMAGAALHTSMGGARHVRQLNRFREAVRNQQISGHFSTILSVGAALFHVPPMNLLHACLFAEWRGARLSTAAENTPREATSISVFLNFARDEIRAVRKTLDLFLAGTEELVVCA